MLNSFLKEIEEGRREERRKEGKRESKVGVRCGGKKETKRKKKKICNLKYKSEAGVEGNIGEGGSRGTNLQL